MIFQYTVKKESFKLITDNNLQHQQINDLKSFAEDAKEISLVSGRADFAAFQILLGSDEDYTVNTGKSAYLSQYPFEKKNYRIAFDFPLPFEISQEYSLSAGDLNCSDMLSPIDVRDYPAGSVCALFVHIPIYKDTAAQGYFGKVRIYRQELFDNEVLVGEISVTLNVKSFAFSSPQKRKFYLDLWQNFTSLAQHTDTPLYSDAHFEVIENYLASMQPLGQRALTLVVSEVPWGGQGGWKVEGRANLFKYSIIPIIKRRSGIFEYDFTKMQRYIDLGSKYGIEDEFSLYGLVNILGGDLGKPSKDYPESIRVRYYNEADGTYRYMQDASEIDGYIKALEKYFIDTDQIDRVRVVADEPTDIEGFKRSVMHLNEIAPSFRFKAAITEPRFIGEFADLFDDFVPDMSTLTKKLDTISSYIKDMPQKRYLWYVCCGPLHPNMFLTSPLSESYLIGILTSYFGLDGFLRWNYTEWTEKPRENLDFRPNWPAGDMHFVYPGYNGKPLLSLRYYALLRGIMFYELLETYRTKYGSDAYAAVIASVIRPKSDYVGETYDFQSFEMPTNDELEAFYEKLLEHLSDL